MKKGIFYLFWVFVCLHTTISFSDAAENQDIVNAMNEIEAIITESQGFEREQDTSNYQQFNAATTEDPNTQVVYTPWELIHRTAMLQGFVWTGSMANFITPAMYIGTPIQSNMNSVGYSLELGATNYAECVRMETDKSFGDNGEMIADTTEDELRDIAKYCAIEFYGTYFEGKEYTTREEMLMMLFTLFDEEVYLPGYFGGKGFIFTSEPTDTMYSNISSRAWYAPYINLAYELMMIEDEDTWTVARKVTDSDIDMMIRIYLMSNENTIMDSIHTRYGTITISHHDFGLTLYKDTEGTIILSSATPEDSSVHNPE